MVSGPDSMGLTGQEQEPASRLLSDHKQFTEFVSFTLVQSPEYEAVLPLRPNCYQSVTTVQQHNLLPLSKLLHNCFCSWILLTPSPLLQTSVSPAHLSISQMFSTQACSIRLCSAYAPPLQGHWKPDYLGTGLQANHRSPSSKHPQGWKITPPHTDVMQHLNRTNSDGTDPRAQWACRFYCRPAVPPPLHP